MTVTTFDGHRYRRDVLKALMEGKCSPTDDPFFLFDVDIAVDDVALIQRRIEAVVTFWRREQANPRYRNIVTALIKDRQELAAVLLDSSRRVEARRVVMRARELEERGRFQHVDEMLDRVSHRWGGVPESRVERLRAAAARAGVSDSEFSARLGRHRIIADVESRLEPPPSTVRALTRALLSEFSQLDEDHPRRSVRTLYDFLGVPRDADRTAITQARDRLGARNRQRSHDRLRTVVDELLAIVSDLLIAGAPGIYDAALAEDVAEALRPHIETAMLLDDRISALEFERLLRDGVASGLTPESARAVVIRLAHELGAPVETGVAVEYVVCDGCNAANPTGAADASCGHCGLGLYRACPRCSRQVPRVSVICGGCELDLGAYRQVESMLRAAQEALEAGSPSAAARMLDDLSGWGGEIHGVQALRRSLERTLDSARSSWFELEALIAEGRLDDAVAPAQNLLKIASDVPSSTGRLPADVVREIEESLDRLSALVESAQSLPDSDRELAVLDLASRYPTNAMVLAALRQLPVAGPSRVRALVGADAIRVNWVASPSQGDITYRVTRLQDGPDGPTSRSIGFTSDTNLEDAGAPAGASVSYEVQALRHGISSGKVGTRQYVATFDVSRLAAVEHDGAISLRWTRLTGHSGIWIERTDLSDPMRPIVTARGSDNGWIDTNVQDGHNYSYRVFVRYEVSGEFVESRGVEIRASAFTVPPIPVAMFGPQTDSSGEIQVQPPTGVVVVRCASRPTEPAGSIRDHRSLGHLGSTITPDERGLVTFRLPSEAMWFVPATMFGTQVVLGEALLHPGITEPEAVVAEATSTGVTLTWTWPSGCTESVVAVGRGAPPSGPDDPDAIVSKVTNTKYDIDRGWQLQVDDPGDFHFLVRPARRVDGALVVLPGAPAVARAHCSWLPLRTVTYRVKPQGRRKKEVRVEVTSVLQPADSLTVVVESLAVDGLAESISCTVGTLTPANKTLVASLDTVELPVRVSLIADLPAARLHIVHPPDHERTIG